MLLFARTDPGRVADHDLNAIVEPFYTTRLREGGTGLGRSVAHGILRTHGGEIEVDSGTVGGATFRVFLPLRFAVG